MRLIGIDYGKKNIGIAISDDQAMMAFPRSVLPNTKNVIDEIVNLAKTEQVETIIVGNSQNYKGEPNQIMERVLPFVETLKSKGLEVIMESELLSSHQAAHFLGKTDMIDAGAASIILQSYIDRKKQQDREEGDYQDDDRDI